MTAVTLRLTLLSGRYAICQLASDATLPAWAEGAFVSVTRTSAEFSVICEESHVPAHVRAERGWRCMAASGPIPFETTGVAASLTMPLAARGISVFLIATFDTDYILVRQETLEVAMAALSSSGHVVARP